jgi:ubiquitin-conjugating enzyme E2 M
LNILRADYSPALTLSSIICGLQFLFDSPNPEDPLNKECAEQMIADRAAWETNLHRSLVGGCTIMDHEFPANLHPEYARQFGHLSRRNFNIED